MGREICLGKICEGRNSKEDSLGICVWKPRRGRWRSQKGPTTVLARIALQPCPSRAHGYPRCRELCPQSKERRRVSFCHLLSTAVRLKGGVSFQVQDPPPHPLLPRFWLIRNRRTRLVGVVPRYRVRLDPREPDELVPPRIWYAVQPSMSLQLADDPFVSINRPHRTTLYARWD